jgi:catechol 2,3-dioxygenase-like lactoylglutathione lyase family enzyme
MMAGMLGAADLVAFAATTDLARARAFYSDTLGLRVVDDTPHAAVFDANGTMLRLTPVDSFVPDPFTVLGWEVEDIEADIDALRERGVDFMVVDGLGQDERCIWTTPDGTKVAWFKDPDGSTLSLTQFAGS